MPASAPRTLIRVTGSSQTYSAVPISWTIQRNGHGVIDTANITLAVQGNPDWAQVVAAGEAIPIAIYSGFPQNPAPGAFSFAQLSERFVGIADTLNPKFSATEQTCEIVCRSYGGVLVDTKTTTNLGATGAVNLAGVTTQQFVQMTAAKHGMQSDFGKASLAYASLQTVYATQQIVGMQNMREWDILMACAETDGAYLWVDGNTLHYLGPNDFTRSIIGVKYGSDPLITFNGTHSQQYAKNIEVEVRSYESMVRTAHRSRVRQSYDSDGNVSSVITNSDSVTMTTQNFGNPGSSMTSIQTSQNSNGTTAVTSASGSSNSVGGEKSSGFLSTPKGSDKERYIFTYHNLNQAQCDAKAKQLWLQISAHEYRGTFTVPVTPDVLSSLDITAKWRVSNLPWYSFDADYLALRYTESFGPEGWKADILGVNHAIPQSVGNY